MGKPHLSWPCDCKIYENFMEAAVKLACSKLIQILLLNFNCVKDNLKFMKIVN